MTILFRSSRYGALVIISVDTVPFFVAACCLDGRRLLFKFRSEDHTPWDVEVKNTQVFAAGINADWPVDARYRSKTSG